MVKTHCILNFRTEQNSRENRTRGKRYPPLSLDHLDSNWLISCGKCAQYSMKFEFLCSSLTLKLVCMYVHYRLVRKYFQMLAEANVENITFWNMPKIIIECGTKKLRGNKNSREDKCMWNEKKRWDLRWYHTSTS